MSLRVLYEPPLVNKSRKMGRPVAVLKMTSEERIELERFSSNQARALLMAASGWGTSEIAKAIGVTPKTVCGWKRAFQEKGLPKEGSGEDFFREWRDLNVHLEWRDLLGAIGTALVVSGSPRHPSTSIYRSNGRSHLLALLTEYLLATEIKTNPRVMTADQLRILRNRICELLRTFGVHPDKWDSKNDVMSVWKSKGDCHLDSGRFKAVVLGWEKKGLVRYPSPISWKQPNNFRLVGMGMMILPVADVPLRQALDLFGYFTALNPISHAD